MSALLWCLLIGGSVALNFAFLHRMPGLALVAGVAYAVALSIRVPS